jgi:ubiquinone/menaquinone biosynthesis C-methylase UbiE
MPRRRDTDWVRRYWDKSAGAYDRSIGLFERGFLGDARRWIGSHARGDVLEIGVGTGRNLPEYASATRLTGIDLSDGMLERARARAKEIGRDVELLRGDAERLDFPDASFDTVVFSLSLCSIPDDAAAVREAARVLRPGGRLVLVEHVGSPRRTVRAIERVIDFFTSRLQGDHMLREPLTHVRAEGLVVEELKRSKLGTIERLVARKPGEPSNETEDV